MAGDHLPIFTSLTDFHRTVRPGVIWKWCRELCGVGGGLQRIKEMIVNFRILPWLVGGCEFAHGVCWHLEESIAWIIMTTRYVTIFMCWTGWGILCSGRSLDMMQTNLLLNCNVFFFKGGLSLAISGDMPNRCYTLFFLFKSLLVLNVAKDSLACFRNARSCDALSSVSKRRLHLLQMMCGKPCPRPHPVSSLELKPQLYTGSKLKP